MRKMYSQLLFILLLSICRGMNDVVEANSSKCLQDQKILLLQLRNNLTYDSELSSCLAKWDETVDCCEWQGVTCNGAGQVIGLDLNREWFSGNIDPLASLKYLSVIRLDDNYLPSHLPDFFAEFTNLTVLSLSSCNLTGVPQKIFQVPTMHTIDLSNNLRLHGTLPEFPSNGSLETLRLSWTKFSGSLPESIGNLRMLSDVSFYACNFTGPVPSSIENLTHLVSVDFALNDFNGSIPSFKLSKNLTYANFEGNLFTGELISSNWDGLENLETLDFSDNSISGLIPPSFFSLPSLKDLNLNGNKFYGRIAELQNVTSPLTNLDLIGNNLAGPLPEFFFQLHNLLRLSLSFNNFSGTVQLHKFTKLKKLDNLDLSHNRLSVDADISESDIALLPQFLVLRLASCNLRTISFLKNQTRLALLDLSKNHIRGEIPNWIWEIFDGGSHSVNLSLNQFTHLQVPYRFGFLNSLDLHANLLTGEVPLPPPKALYVDLSRNKFHGFISPEFSNHLSNAQFFSVAHNKVSGTIPSSICNATDLEVLDLSSNSLDGSIPECLAEQSLMVLHLGGNNLRGNIPGNFSEECRLESIDLSYNHLEGKIPQSLSNCSNLKLLNVERNKISDTFPCWVRKLSNLHVLELRFNNFHGSIDCPGVNYSWPALRIIDLASNNFSGILPRNLFLELEAMKVDSAHSPVDHLYAANRIFFGDDLRAQVDIYYQDTVTITLKGQEMSLPKIWFTFCSIDFSNNSFVGGIPETVGELKSLYLLNLSHNALTGQIPPVIGNLQDLGILDLSFNKLDGRIPDELSRIPRLSFLNLSYNELVGRIPQGTQIQTFDNKSFMGNEGLCGFQMDKACSNDREEPQPPLQPAASEDEQFFSRTDIYAGAALGFAVSVSMIFLPLLVSRRWRKCYNKMVDGLVLRVFSNVDVKKRRANTSIGEIYRKKKAGQVQRSRR
ncbi:hypothetical protein CQW23_20019 [Capsicum baccatum]|uniref:Leucine-rich repeat-containing N-terminal plant-type domain-containing protein n=1 Tax=Capsicum baccatum TaxID=33114 RepID=A0A2G2W7E9_CAPBA|nr:hypothetical protein CQW23_20019 [Capsicum baccatum]